MMQKNAVQPQKNDLKIGLLGGTFDPVHRGHLHIAEAACAQFSLDALWFMPAGNPYFKAGTEVTPAEVRLAMTRAFAAPYAPRFVCCDIEARQAGKTYTSETLRELRRLVPDASFYFIIGADSLYQLESWHEPEALFQSATLLCAARPEAFGHILSEGHVHGEGERRRLPLAEEIARLTEKYHSVGCDIRCIDTPPLDISSTEIRSRCAAGTDISALVTPEVEAFIYQHGLYGAKPPS